MDKVGKLSNMQVEIVKMFNYDLDPSQIDEIKDILSDYFARKTTEEMDKFMNENELGEKDIESWAEEHIRRKK